MKQGWNTHIAMTTRAVALLASAWVLAVPWQSALAEEPPVPRAAVAELADRVLPVEQPYDYHRSLADGPLHRPCRDPATGPAAGEMVIPARGWKVLFARGADPLLRHAAEDLSDFLQVSMQVRLPLEPRGQIDDWAQRSNAIIVGTRDQLPAIGSALRGSKDYALRAGPDRIVVCGFDARGALFGTYNLEARLRLREGPFLPEKLDTVRHSLYQTRMALSWLGWMEWPDHYLAHLAHDGFDAIFASVYANPNGVEGPPHYDLIRRQDPQRLHDLIRRARRQGIKVYAPILYNYTGEPENEAGLRRHVRSIVTEFPDLHGYILLSEGFHYRSFHAVWQRDKREWSQHWTRAVGIVAEECHRIDPEIEILPWEYNLDFRPQGVELKRYIIGLLPEDTIPLLTWENGKRFEIDHLRGYLRDYSISQVGPAEVAKAQIAKAKRRGMTVYCKADTFATWQFGTIPYLPCPYQWQRRYDALRRFGVNGTLETWSNGYKPNFVAELRSWSSWTNPLGFDDLLRAIARRQFGAGSEQRVLKAWRDFSDAIQLVPDTGPSMGTNFAVANPLFFRPPPPRTMMVRHSWWDEAKWSDRITGTKLNPYWPYTHTRMVFYPDFTNRRNAAEQYARTWSGISASENRARLAKQRVLPIFNTYLLKAADRFAQGLRSYRRAALEAPPAKRATALKEVLVAEQIERMLRSNQAILEFEDVRLALAKTDQPEEKERLCDRLCDILRQEIARTKRSLAAARRDSRLGYECEQDYVYTPYVLSEKLALLQETLEKQIPAYRRQQIGPREKRSQ